MQIDDESLRSDQRNKRKDLRETDDKSINVGDTVTPTNKTDKHKANDMFLVTAKKKDMITVQKILHPLSKELGKIMSQ